MALYVVDVLEMVSIGDENCHRLTVARRAIDLPPDRWSKRRQLRMLVWASTTTNLRTLLLARSLQRDDQMAIDATAQQRQWHRTERSRHGGRGRRPPLLAGLEIAERAGLHFANILR